MLAEFLAVPFVVLVNVANLELTPFVFGDFDLIGQYLVTDFS